METKKEREKKKQAGKTSFRKTLEKPLKNFSKLQGGIYSCPLSKIYESELHSSKE